MSIPNSPLLTNFVPDFDIAPFNQIPITAGQEFTSDCFDLIKADEMGLPRYFLRAYRDVLNASQCSTPTKRAKLSKELRKFKKSAKVVDNIQKLFALGIDFKPKYNSALVSEHLFLATIGSKDYVIENNTTVFQLVLSLEKQRNETLSPFRFISVENLAWGLIEGIALEFYYSEDTHFSISTKDKQHLEDIFNEKLTTELEKRFLELGKNITQIMEN